jgi:hypothetical protein
MSLKFKVLNNLAMLFLRLDIQVFFHRSLSYARVCLRKNGGICVKQKQKKKQTFHFI